MITAGTMIVLSGCSGDDASGSTDAPAADAPEAQVSLAPADGSADVSPVVLLEISVTDGELADVTLVDGTLVDGAGAEIPGAVDASEGPYGAVWMPEMPLAYGTQYTLTTSAVNEDDEETTASSTFTTVTPETLSTPITSTSTTKAADESDLEVTSSTPTDGVLNDGEVYFRPSTYWPADIEVTLDANHYGVDFGKGVWARRTAASASRSAPGMSRSSTRAATPCRCSTATSWCRRARSAPVAPTSRAGTARTSSPSSTATASWTQHLRRAGGQHRRLPDARRVRRPARRQR